MEDYEEQPSMTPKGSDGNPIRRWWLEEIMKMLESGSEIDLREKKSRGFEQKSEEDKDDLTLESFHLMELLLKDNEFPPVPNEFLMRNPADKFEGRQQLIPTYDLIEIAAIKNLGGFDDLCGVGFPGSNEDMGLELIHMLLWAADSIGTQRYGAARQMLLQCKKLSTPFGNSAKRIGYYFTEAMEEKIDVETRKAVKKIPTLNLAENLPNIEAKTKEIELCAISWYKSLPYSKVAHFTANQAILEAVGNAKKIHIFDFDITNGIQWPSLMQSLGVRQCGPPQTLKITAIEMRRSTKTATTGKRLTEFAESLNISFAFQTAVISKIEDVNVNLFEVDPDEAVAVNAPFVLQNLMQKPNRLKSLVAVISKLQPLIFTVIHNEGHHNSASFVKRFIEVLFYYSAIFDSLDADYERWDLDRLRIERFLVAPGMRNMVACEGKERVIRHVQADVWRSFMKEVGFTGVPFSHSAKYQANLLLGEFRSEECFTIGEKQLALTVGWKNTPIFSISAWMPNTLKSYMGRSFYSSRNADGESRIPIWHRSSGLHIGRS